MSPHPAAPAMGELLNNRQKVLIYVSLMITMFISALDQSIVATATPRILADLGGFPLLSWVFTVYLLASTVIVPLVGKLSDMFGRKPFILGGIAIFVGASMACGLAPTMPALIAARAAQGVGGGLLFGSVFATLGDIFTPIQRARYMGYFISAFTLASLSGPTIGGFLTDGPGWRWCFYINLPVGIIASTLIWVNLPMARKGGRLRDIDFAGAALLGTATVCALLALVWANEKYGWGGAPTLGLFAAAAILTVAFVKQESRHPQAILPLTLFRNRVFVQANAFTVLQGGGMMGAVQYLPTFIQTSLGASATASGIVSTPQSLGLLATSIVGGQLVARTGRWKAGVIVGALCSAVAAALMMTLDVGVPKWHIALFMVVFGLGGGLIGPTMSVVIQSAVPHEQMGVATSGRQFFMQIGQVLGVALFGVVFTTTYASAFDTELPAAARTALPTDAYEEFRDPTLALDRLRFARVTKELQGQEGGQAVLAQTVEAQKEGVADAIQRLYLFASIAGVFVVLLAIFIPEIPLRRNFGPPAARPEGEGTPELVPVEAH